MRRHGRFSHWIVVVTTLVFMISILALKLQNNTLDPALASGIVQETAGDASMVQTPPEVQPCACDTKDTSFANRQIAWRWQREHTFTGNQTIEDVSRTLLPYGKNRDCLRNKWVYMIGDSSLRIFRNAYLWYLQEEFNSTIGSTPDPFMGCPGPDNPTQCFRENVDLQNGLRVPYSWKTYQDFQVDHMRFFVTPDDAPDLFIFTSGAWDTHDRGPETYEEATTAAQRQILDTLSAYPSSLVLAMTTVSCHPYQHRSLPWNAIIRPKLLAISSPRFAILDREPSTASLPISEPGDQKGCHGFHAERHVSWLHIGIMLDSLCPL